MTHVFRKLVSTSSRADQPRSTNMTTLVSKLHYELVPMTSIEQAIGDLPPGANVSVTCSPAKGIPATLDYATRLAAQGFHVVPHIAARMVESKDHTVELATWSRNTGVDEIYIVAGDAPDPRGPYDGAAAFLYDLLEAKPHVSRVGFAGYPDGHAFIPQDVLDEQVLLKQSVLAEFDVDGWISTQMCFDTTKVRAWLTAERARGVTLPIRLGVPGVVDRARLMKMGTRLGIGASMRYLSKNRSTVMRLMSPGGFDPTEMVAEFADDADELGIEALHSFTFNAVADTRRWQEAMT